MTIPYQIINLGLKALALGPKLSLSLASANPKRASARTLRRILRRARNTVYGREHHFSAILKARNPEQLFRLYEKSVEASGFEEIGRAHV